jgi:hypothetical protein
MPRERSIEKNRRLLGWEKVNLPMSQVACIWLAIHVIELVRIT